MRASSAGEASKDAQMDSEYYEKALARVRSISCRQ